MRKILSSFLAVFLALPAYAENVGFNNEADKTVANTAGTSTLLATDKKGKLILGALSGIYAEDAAFANGGSMMMSGAVNNRSLSVFNSTNGDATPFGVGDYGNNFSSLLYDAALGNQSPIKAEDGAFGNTDKLITVGFQTQDPLSVDQDASGDAAIPKVDRSGRTITTMAPAGESWQACGTATATTSDVAIKAAVASNRIYVTSIVCKNTSATVASSLDFKDGTTVMAVGGISQMATASAGSFGAVFPVPLRGTSNTALNFATNVSVSSVTCCAAGYVATN